MHDHDQRFKLLLREFFPEFFQLFFPSWAERFDFSKTEWLDKEVFADPPQGERRFLDLVAQVATKVPVPTGDGAAAESWIALIHVEIEQAETVAPLRARMLDYYHLLRRRYQLPVLPIALYLRVGLEGLGHDAYEERFWDLPVLHFEFLYVGLPALAAEEYVIGANPLGVALSALMKAPPEEKARMTAEALRRIHEMPNNEWRRFLLGDTVLAYSPLDDLQQNEYERLLTSENYKEAKEMASTIAESIAKKWYDKGHEEGVEQGREQGREEGRVQTLRGVLVQLVEEHFGPLNEQVRGQIEALPVERLTPLVNKVSKAQSLKELGLED